MDFATKDTGHTNQIRTKKILQNFGSMATGKLLGDAFTFLLFVVLSRTYGQKGIGQYSFAMALTGFFAVFSSFGLYHFSVKEMSRYSGPLGEYYGSIFSVRLILSAIVFSVLLATLFFLSFSHELKLIITLIGTYQIFYFLMNGFTAVFVACEEMHLAGLLEFSLRAIIAIFGIAVVMMGGSFTLAIVAFPIASFGGTLVAWKMVVKRHGRLTLSISWSSLKHILRNTFPYAIATILLVFSTRMDVIFLGFYLGVKAAGIYNVAYREIFLFIFITHFAAMSIFPLASKLYMDSRAEFEALYHRSLNVAVFVGIPVTFGLWLIAPNLITLFFGATFTESIAILRILVWLLLLAALENIMAAFLISCDQQIDRAKGYWTATWSNLLGNIILIPIFGMKGAAVATLISRALQVSCYTVKLRPLVGWPRIGRKLAISSLATASFFVPFMFFPTTSILVVVPASILLCCGTLMLFKEVRENEIRLLLTLFKEETESTKPISQ